jgi:hypothetical protein
METVLGQMEVRRCYISLLRIRRGCFAQGVFEEDVELPGPALGKNPSCERMARENGRRFDMEKACQVEVYHRVDTTLQSTTQRRYLPKTVPIRGLARRTIE